MDLDWTIGLLTNQGPGWIGPDPHWTNWTKNDLFKTKGGKFKIIIFARMVAESEK